MSLRRYVILSSIFVENKKGTFSLFIGFRRPHRRFMFNRSCFSTYSRECIYHNIPRQFFKPYCLNFQFIQSLSIHRYLTSASVAQFLTHNTAHRLRRSRRYANFRKYMKNYPNHTIPDLQPLNSRIHTI